MAAVSITNNSIAVSIADKPPLRSPATVPHGAEGIGSNHSIPFQSKQPFVQCTMTRACEDGVGQLYDAIMYEGDVCGFKSGDFLLPRLRTTWHTFRSTLQPKKTVSDHHMPLRPTPLPIQ